MSHIIKGLGLQKKQSRPVSRILSGPVIYLCGLPLPESKRAALCARHPGIYMALQPARRTAFCVATEAGELLPHLLTMTRAEARAVIFFSVTIPLQISSLSEGQCPVLSGLSSPG